MHPEVYDAARLGKLDSLETIISRNGEDLFHQTTPKKNNILHIAAQHEQVNFIEQLLQCSSSSYLLWQGNYKGDTPLHIAAKVGSYEMIQVFTDSAKSLHRDVENGQVDTRKELLRKPNLNGDTTLHYAIREDKYSVVKLLIEEDPQLCNITNAADESPLYLATDRRLLDIIELILGASSLSFSHKGPRGLTALHATALHATVYSSHTTLQKILEKRREVIREQDDLGRTPLHYIAWWGSPNAVNLVLQHDPSVAYVVDKEGQSALHITASRGHVNVIKELLRSCPDACDIVDTKGRTALHAAVVSGQENVVKYILEMPNLKDLINEQDTNGDTALHLAALHKCYPIIYILAQDKRVDRSATNKDYLTAIDIFCNHNEVGYNAAKVKHLLGNSYGTLGCQGQLIKKCVRKRLDRQFVEDQLAVPTITGSNLADRKNGNSSIRSIIDLQVLAAVLIATVTFAATFTMPGGYNNDGPNQGMATLAGRAAFQAFVITNTTAFSFSVLAIFFQLDTAKSTRGPSLYQHRYIHMAGKCIGIAILGMVLAFACGTYVVLTRTIGLGIIPFAMAGCLVIMYVIGIILDPETRIGRRSFGRYGRKLLFDNGII